MSHKYKLKYDFKPEVGEFTADDLRESGLGGCDIYAYFSILHPEDGSYSMMFGSIDGHTGEEMTSKEYFKAWMMMGKKLSQREDLDEDRRELLSMPSDIWFDRVVK